jgi:hypothetical protein
VHNIGEILERRVLVTREPARLLRERLDSVVLANPTEIELSLEGTHLMNPSFFDELLKGFLAYLVPENSSTPRLVLWHSPVDLAGFSDILRTYGLKTEHKPPRWIIQRESPRFARPKPRVSP